MSKELVDRAIARGWITLPPPPPVTIAYPYKGRAPRKWSEEQHNQFCKKCRDHWTPEKRAAHSAFLKKRREILRLQAAERLLANRA